MIAGYSEEGTYLESLKKYVNIYGVKGTVKTLGVKKEFLDLCVPMDVNAHLKNTTESSVDTSKK